MKVELSVVERLVLLNGVIPTQGVGIADLMAGRNITEKIAFNSDEIEALDFKQPGDTFEDENGIEQSVEHLAWSADTPEGVVRSEFDLSAKEAGTIAKSLEAKDKAKELTTDHISLWAKFVDGEKIIPLRDE